MTRRSNSACRPEGPSTRSPAHIRSSRSHSWSGRSTSACPSTTATGSTGAGRSRAPLDLALRQAGLSLAAALGRTPAPVRFVVSRRLPKPPTVEPLRAILRVFPDTRFKLDPTSDWTERPSRSWPSSTPSRCSISRVRIADRRRPATRPSSIPARSRGASRRRARRPRSRRAGDGGGLASHHERISWDAVIHSVPTSRPCRFRRAG